MDEVGIVLEDSINVSRLISAFSYCLPIDFAYGGEQHPGWEFVYVCKGKVCIQAGELTYILKSGEMVCHKPMEFHSIKPYNGSAQIIVFCFECSNAKMQFFNNKIIMITPRQRQYILDIADRATYVFAEKPPLEIVRDRQMDRLPNSTAEFEQYVKNSIELLILSLMSAQSTDLKRRSEFYEISTERQTLTSDIIHYLHEHLSETIRLADVSKQFSYSLSSIKRIFKEDTGYNIIEYLNNLRIEKAKTMLSGQPISLDVVAQEVGFTNIYYFSNAFMKKTGMRPSEYRASHTNK